MLPAIAIFNAILIVVLTARIFQMARTIGTLSQRLEQTSKALDSAADAIRYAGNGGDRSWFEHYREKTYQMLDEICSDRPTIPDKPVGQGSR